MSTIAKLLEGAEVEWKTLGEVCENLDSMRKPVTSGLRETGIIPYYGASGVVDYVKDYIFDGDFLLVSEDGANLIARVTPIAFSISGKTWVNNHAHVLKFNTYAERRFIEYYLNSIDLTQYISGAAQPKLNQRSLNSIYVPTPPLPVQSEIVRILDIFTEHTAELTSELLKRRVQYKYYMTLLFDNVKESDLHSIAKVCHIEKGTTPIQKAIPGKYPMVVTTAERKSCETYQFDAKAVCIPLVSSRGHGVASLNQVYYQEGKFALGNILCAIIPKNEEQVCSKYLYYYFQLTKEYTLVPLMKGGANVALRIDDIEKVKVPIPPLEEQSRIVSILDKFDTLTNSISEGLPKEIELRKKQYEYYRDLLLTFPKNNIES